MTTSLVTGGAGFIGSHIVDHLVRMGHKVVILDDLSGGDVNNVPANAILVPGSILDTALIQRLFCDYQFDHVYHLAAYAAEALSAHIRRFNYENNLIGSVNLVNAAVNAGTVKHFVFTSSAAVYGHRAHGADEIQYPTPIDPYAIAKFAVEMDLKAAQEVFGLSHTIFRLHNVYGERQSLSDPYRNFIGLAMRACLKGEPMKIFGDGSQTRAFTYIDDVAPLMAEAINLPAAENQVVNLGTDANVTILDAARLVAEAMGVEPRFEFLPARPEAKVGRTSHSRARCIFGVRDYVTLPEGLARTAAWARTQTLREPRVFAGVEIERGMPESWRAHVKVPNSAR